jgi:hypothetical protein
MRQQGGEIDDTGGLVDRRRLHGGDLMLEPAGQRGLAERALGLARASWPNGCHQRFLRIGQIPPALWPMQARGKRWIHSTAAWLQGSNAAGKLTAPSVLACSCSR